MASKNDELKLNEKELAILLNHLGKEYSEVTIKYKPKPEDTLARIDFKKQRAELLLTNNQWKRWFCEINDRHAFPTWEKIKELYLKLSVSEINNLNLLVDNLRSHSFSMIGIDTNMLYFLFFSRHLFPALRKERIHLPQIIVPHLVIEEINNAINQENKEPNKILNKKHKLRIHPKLNYKKRRGLVASSELFLIKPRLALLGTSENKGKNQKNFDQLIVESLENYARRVKGRIVVLSKDRDVVTMAENHDLDAMIIEFAPPSPTIRWPLASLAEFLYLLTAELALLTIEEICTIDIVKIGNVHKDWKNRMTHVTFEKGCDTKLKEEIMRDIRIARKLSKILQS